MSSNKEFNRFRLSALFCIGLGLLLGVFMKRVTIGLLIGLALGLLSGAFLSKKD